MSRLRLAVFAFLLVPSLLAAQPVPTGLQDYALTTWNENDGLSATRIMAIAQARDGYLWLGTDAGLVRFDGVHFEPFPRSTGPNCRSCRPVRCSAPRTAVCGWA